MQSLRFPRWPGAHSERNTGVSQVVVNRLGNPGGDQIESAIVRQLAHLLGGILRVVAADVEEIADIMRFENVDDAFEVKVLTFLELVAAGADAPGRGRRAQ